MCECVRFAYAKAHAPSALRLRCKQCNREFWCVFELPIGTKVVDGCASWSVSDATGDSEPPDLEPELPDSAYD